MEPLTFETLNRRPEVLEALELQARRERAETVYRLIVRPFRRLRAERTAGRKPVVLAAAEQAT